MIGEWSGLHLSLSVLCSTLCHDVCNVASRLPQTCEELASPLELEELPGVLVNLEASFDPAREAILDLREHVEDLCNAELGKITKKGG